MSRSHDRFAPCLYMSALLATALVAACAGDLRPAANGADGGPSQSSSAVTFAQNADRSTKATVDASAADKWIYVSLDERKEVKPASPASSREWDLAFQRFKIQSNSGNNGSGDVRVARLADARFEDTLQAPAAGYAVDAPDGDDEGTDPDTAFLAGDGWYAYDVARHELSPRAVVYVVRTVGGRYLKLRFTGYYDSAGTAAHVSFDFASVLAPPAAPATLAVDATSATQWTYVDATAGTIVTVADPATSLAWDLAFRGASVRTNGGTSGAGHGGARLAPAGSRYEALGEAPTTGYASDALLPLPGPPGSGTVSANPSASQWYDYDPATHAVTPKDAVFFVRTAAGAYTKLRVASYAGGRYELLVAPISRKVLVDSTTINASDAASFVYLSLRRGEVVAVTEPGGDLTWDVAFSRTTIRTNSGTSGTGRGGALDPGAAALSELATAPEDGYLADEMMPLPGPPGSGTISGNRVLSSWYDYDPATHAVSPKDRAFVVRTADGAFAKVKITGYAAGVYTLTSSFAGPGQKTF